MLDYGMPLTGDSFPKLITSVRNAVLNEFTGLINSMESQSSKEPLLKSQPCTDKPPQSYLTRARRAWQQIWHPVRERQARRISLSRAGSSAQESWVRVEPELKGQKNLICNQKYSAVSFVPKVLFQQFKYFFNFFYLLLCLSQTVPFFQVGLLFTYLAPLLLVLSLTMLKEGYDDYQRYTRDLEANSREYRVFTGAQFQMKKSMDLQVGDIVEIKAHDRLPADLLFLQSSDEQGSVFLKTDQLDGETDWKLRKACRITQALIAQQGLEAVLQGLVVNAMEPIVNIYKLEASVEFCGQVQGLDVTNSGWASTVLATGCAWGLVLYSGEQLRAALNGRAPRYKFGKVDEQMNYLSKLLFGGMCLMSLVLVLMRGVSAGDMGSSLRAFICYIVLLSNIIPISMRVNLDFAKLYYSLMINMDHTIHTTTVRNSNIPEELGRIQFLLTDKTGTLTQNLMSFKKISLEAGSFTQEDFPALKTILANYAQYFPSELLAQRAPGLRRPPEEVLYDLLFAVALCHSVTPVNESDGSRVLQSSSPDEVALVEFGESMGLSLQQRTQRQITLRFMDRKLVFSVLLVFPFSSESKRMGIVLRNEKGLITLYLKGADTELKRKVRPNQADSMMDYCEELARDGLRTMVLSQKVISEEEWAEFSSREKQVKAMMGGREAELMRFREDLERGMEFLGVTGVEDKLQVDVKDTLESLKNAGMAVWMLTGDKVETALCVSISTGLKSLSQQVFIIREQEEEELALQKLREFQKMHNTVLIIDGTSYKTIASDHLEEFVRIACASPAVVVSRCSPTQKAEIVEAIRRLTGKTTCAIGDGGNDVGMIQAGDVGVGVVGKEGIQAVLASDFSVDQFSYLKKLALWHGRQSMKRSCNLAQFIMHRGMIISVTQTIFIVLFNFVEISMYDGLLLLGYSTIFTMFPVFSLILDQDVDQQAALEYPELYRSLQRGRELSARSFLAWLALSLYQGFVIMLLSVLLFGESSIYMLETTSFSALILIEFLNVFTSINSPHLLMVLSTFLSMVVYALTLVLMKNYLHVEGMGWSFFARVLLITAAAWLLPFLLQLLLACYLPSDFDKVMRGRKKKMLTSLT